MAPNWWWCYATRSGRESGDFTHLILNYSSDVLWSPSINYNGGPEIEIEREREWLSSLTRAEPFRTEAKLARVSSFKLSVEWHWHKTKWGPLNQHPECPKYKPAVWIIPAFPWNNEWMQRGLRGYGVECVITSVDMVGFFFIIDMQYLAAALEHLPCLCKLALLSSLTDMDEISFRVNSGGKRGKTTAVNVVNIWKWMKHRNIKGYVQ